jgi:hypothetical protein
VIDGMSDRRGKDGVGEAEMLSANGSLRESNSHQQEQDRKPRRRKQRFMPAKVVEGHSSRRLDRPGADARNTNTNNNPTIAMVPA